MSRSLTVTPVIGLPNLTGWAQVVQNQSGELVCAYSVAGHAAHNSGRDLADVLTASTPSDAISLHQLLLDLLAKARRAGVKLHLSCVLQTSDRLVLAAIHGSILYQGATHAAKCILQAEGEPQLVEGKLKPNATFVVATESVEPYFDTILSYLSSGMDGDTLVTTLLPELQAETESATTSLAVVSTQEPLNNAANTPSQYIVESKQSLQPSSTVVAEEVASSHEEETSYPSDADENADVADGDELETSYEEPYQPTSSSIDYSPSSQPRAQSRRLFSTVPQEESQTTFIQQPDSVPRPNFKVPRFAISTPKLPAVPSFDRLTNLAAMVNRHTHTFLSSGKQVIQTAIRQLTRKKSAQTTSHQTFAAQSLFTTERTATRTSPPQLLIGLIGFGAVLLIGGGGWWLQQQRTKMSLVQTALQPLTTELAAAQSLAQTDPLAARDKTAQVVTSLKKLATDHPSGIEGQKIKTQLAAAEKFASDISGLNQLQTLPVFFDLRLTEPNFLANTVKLASGSAYFIDNERKQIAILDLTKKQSQAFVLTGLTKLTQFAPTTTEVYFLGNGLSLWQSSAPAPVSELKPEGDSNREATLMAQFSSYLYLFNPAKRNIFRYSITKTKADGKTTIKLSDPIGWLIDKKDLDFSQVHSLAVDGDVWLGTKTGRILKYTKGEPITWNMTGVQNPPTSSLLVVTSDELQKLYVLEPDKKRLLVLDKSGQFLKELQSPTLGAVTSFAVNELLQKAFLISGSTVYELAL